MYYLNNNYTKNSFLTNMSVTNTIFNTFSRKLVTNERANSLDYGIMNTEEEKYFNTYRYWKPFFAANQPLISSSDKKDENGENIIQKFDSREKNDDGTIKEGGKGDVYELKTGIPDEIRNAILSTKSLFNNVNAVPVQSEYRDDINMPLLDSPDSRISRKSKMACTITDLVNASIKGELGRQVYNFSDFAYCKHLGKIPNNYLITLRRFGSPCGDKIDKRRYSTIKEVEDAAQKHNPDIGRMITWLGTPGNEMSNILKYNYKMQWEDVEAQLDAQQVETPSGPIAQIFNISNPQYRKAVQTGQLGVNGVAGGGYMSKMFPGSTDTPYKGTWNAMLDRNKIYGPVDVIDKTKRRKQGLVFEQQITLTFDYELRSYYGVNGKAAFTDLLANILATTYVHGDFWGGERRFYGGMQDNIFANLPIFQTAADGKLNDPQAVVKSLVDSIKDGAKALSTGFEGGNTLEKTISAIKEIGAMILGDALNKLGRPQKFALSSLLSGAPVGCWHLTIGNPKAPILEIGNLICTNTEIEHYGPLGLDDFPTGIRVKVTLEHGQPRDIMGIEQMYNRGDTRLYTPMGDNIMDMYNESSPVFIDENNENKLTLDTKLYSEFNNKANSTKDLSNLEVTNKAKLVKINENHEEDLSALVRYFGTNDKKIIVAASRGALYGVPKNIHIKEKTGGLQ